MAVVIGSIVTEVAVTSGSRESATTPAGRNDEDIDLIVRRASEHVLETLRREWDR